LGLDLDRYQSTNLCSTHTGQAGSILTPRVRYCLPPRQIASLPPPAPRRWIETRRALASAARQRAERARWPARSRQATPPRSAPGSPAERPLARTCRAGPLGEAMLAPWACRRRREDAPWGSRGRAPTQTGRRRLPASGAGVGCRLRPAAGVGYRHAIADAGGGPHAHGNLLCTHAAAPRGSRYSNPVVGPPPGRRCDRPFKRCRHSRWRGGPGRRAAGSEPTVLQTTITRATQTGEKNQSVARPGSGYTARALGPPPRVPEGNPVESRPGARDWSGVSYHSPRRRVGSPALSRAVPRDRPLGRLATR
jgi:hypothetical protein